MLLIESRIFALLFYGARDQVFVGLGEIKSDIFIKKNIKKHFLKGGKVFKNDFRFYSSRNLMIDVD